MTRKGDKQTPWTTYEIAYLKENAGIVPAREIQFMLKRSYKSVHHMANRLGLSLRVPTWTLEWCDECANWRSRINPKTGRCSICQTKLNIESEEDKCADVLSRMSPRQREIYETNEAKRGRRKAYLRAPKYPDLSGMSNYYASKKKEEYFRELERWHEEIINHRYDAVRTRLKRMRQITGENPRKNN